MVLTFAQSRILLSEALGGDFRTWLCLEFNSGSEKNEIEEALRKLSPEGGSVTGRVMRGQTFVAYRMVLVVQRAGILRSEEFKEFCEKHVNGKRMGCAQDYVEDRDEGAPALREAVVWMRRGLRFPRGVGELFGDTWLELAILGESQIMDLAWSRGRPLGSAGEWKDLFEAYEESRAKRVDDEEERMERI